MTALVGPSAPRHVLPAVVAELVEAPVAESAPAGVTGPSLFLASRRPQQFDLSPTEADTTIRPTQPDAGQLPLQEMLTNGSPPRWWPMPVELLAQLERLSWQPELGEWSLQVSDLIRELVRTSGPHDGQAAVILARLRALAEVPHPLVSGTAAEPVAVQLRLVQHALLRRLDIWQQVAAMPQATEGSLADDRPMRQSLAACLALVTEQTEQGGNAGQLWRQYLLLDSLKDLAQQQDSTPPLAQRKLARRVLARLRYRNLSVDQHEFLTTGPLATLETELRRWAAEPTNPRQLLEQIEDFEQSGLPSDAELLAAHCHRLTWSPDPAEQQMGQWLEAHYRNANLRLAVTDDLLNLLIPAPAPRQDDVRETILGLPTRSRCTTTTILDVRLLPDAHRLRLSLQAQGLVSGQAQTTSGSVTLHNTSGSRFTAEKELELTTLGVRTRPAEAQASVSTRLQRVESDFEAVPILGMVVEAIARGKAADNAAAAQREAEWKTTRRIRESVDALTTAQIAEAEQQIHSRVLDPLARLDLTPEYIELQTGQQRFTMRLRLADDEQLASYAPRPRALSDSLISLQVHQSLFNNLCEKLSLDGRTFTLAELHQHLTAAMGLTNRQVPESFSQDLSITFPPRDSVQVVCRQGRIELNLAIAELEQGSRRWHDFVVHVFFKPDEDIRHGSFVRDGTIHLSGRPMSTTAQIPLRGIFSKIFPASRQLPVLPKQWQQNPRLAELEVTQMEVRDGWIGVAVGPRRSAQFIERQEARGERPVASGQRGQPWPRSTGALNPPRQEPAG